MANGLLLLFGIIVFQGCSKAAPSESSDLVTTTTSSYNGPSNLEGDVTLNRDGVNEKHQSKNNDASQNQRRKRFFDYVGLDYPSYDYPTFPFPSVPHYSKRDDSHSTAVYGTQDTLGIIYRRLQDILRDVRNQNVQRPVHTPIPAYIPFLFVPQFDCGCTSNNQGPAPPVNTPRPQPALPPTSSDTPPSGVTTNVTFDNRDNFEKRQNWGIATNKPDYNIIGDGSRPINFKPIPPEDANEVPAPPVDHGTVQAGAEPAQSPKQISTRPQSQTTPGPLYRPSRPPVTFDSASKKSENVRPSLCDGAILSCCARPEITDKCFESLGCQDPYIYGSPCDPKVQTMVIEKFVYFQKRRAG